MKKQLIATAVAASMSAAALADVAITGNAKFEYDNTDSAGTTSNTTNTEVNLMVKGKNGDTGVVANFELNTHGGNTADGSGIDVEDLYMTTKVGDVAVKAGNWASGTSAHLGEIDNGPRSDNKIDLSYTMGDIKVYAGSSGSAGNGDGEINDNMYAGVVLSNVMGNTINLKKHNEVQDSYGIKGSVGGLNYRVEAASHDTEGDTTFAELSTSLGAVKLNYAMLSADNAAALDEDDSSLFAVSTGTADNVTATGQKQIWASTTLAGTVVDVKMGTIEKGIETRGAGANQLKDRDYTQVKATRKLSSGSTAVITFTDQDIVYGTSHGTSSKENLEIELNVAF